jgi:hypothetical protein
MVVTNISGTYNLIANSIWQTLVLQEVRLECNTSLAPVTINLFEIAELNRLWNVKIYITDISANASVNNIIVNASGSDTIDATGVTQLVISNNGVSAVFAVVNQTQWVALESNASSAPIPTSISYGLFSQIQSSADVVGLGEQTLIGAGIGSLTVPPNTFNVGDAFHLKMGGEVSSQNNQNIEFRIKSGSIILEDSGVVNLPQTTNRFWEIEVDFTIRAIGVAGVASIVSNGQLVYTKDASASYEGAGLNFVNNTTFDTTIVNTLNVTAEWLTLNVINKIHTDYLILTKTF